MQYFDMDITSAYSAMHHTIENGMQYSYVAFMEFLIMLLRPDIVDKKNRPKIIPQPDIPDCVDWIIIGGGSAGCVIANRLTEKKYNWSILLLEAGEREPLISDVPSDNGILQGTKMDWNFKSEPSSKYCLSMPNNQCNHARGKALGGCSFHNGLLYVRGNKRDYDHWRDLGNPGWGYKDVLPYFKKSQDMRISDLQKSPYHATGGYLTVEKFRYNPPLTHHFIEAGRDMGYNVIDVNGPTQTGFTYSPATLRDGLRCSTAKAFLRSASHRKNLHVSTESTVLKILINETTKTAHAVQFLRGGKIHTVCAKKEIILSAGAYQSPQILMLSGIGPKEHLKELGIKVIHDSPGVGQNLQDHVAAPTTYLTDVPWTCEEPNKEDGKCSANGGMSGAQQFLEEKSGPLYGCPRDGAIAFLNTKYANSSLDYPDVELGFAGMANSPKAGFCKKPHRNKKDHYFASLSEGHPKNYSFIGTVFDMRPESRGYVKLRDANPHSPPIIVDNFFKNKHDLDILLEGVKLAHKLSQTPTMKKINARPDPNAVPECAHFPFLSDEYWRCLIVHQTSTAFHPTCTCKMGPADDVMAVVDSRLRVHGVKNLRIADASIMPKIPSGHTNAPTIMIAEKASDLIKQDHRLGEKKQKSKTEGSRSTRNEKSERV